MFLNQKVFVSQFEKSFPILFQGKQFKKGNSPYNSVIEFLNKNKKFKVDNYYENKSYLTVAKKGFLKKIK